jgi:hypothetical protein
MIVCGGRFDLKKERLSDIDADIRGEPLDIAGSRAGNLPGGVSGKLIFAGDGIGARLSSCRLEQKQDRHACEQDR